MTVHELKARERVRSFYSSPGGLALREFQSRYGAAIVRDHSPNASPMALSRCWNESNSAYAALRAEIERLQAIERAATRLVGLFVRLQGILARLRNRDGET